MLEVASNIFDNFLVLMQNRHMYCAATCWNEFYRFYQCHIYIYRDSNNKYNNKNTNYTHHSSFSHEPIWCQQIDQEYVSLIPNHPFGLIDARPLAIPGNISSGILFSILSIMIYSFDSRKKIIIECRLRIQYIYTFISMRKVISLNTMNKTRNVYTLYYFN